MKQRRKSITDGDARPHATRGWRRAAALTVVGIFLATLASPAVADGTATSPATLTVPQGVLEITVDNGQGTLGKMVSSINGGRLTATIGRVVVQDNRNAPAGAGWVASVVSTDFTAPGGSRIPASRISYTAGKIDKSGTATYTAHDPVKLKKPVPAVTATDITGKNTATWYPTITVDVPGSAPAGTYTATITHSVL